MKRKIRLTESELYTLLNESVKSILNEISIKDKYQKETQTGKNRHPYDLFAQLCFLDPTTTENKVGKYSNWLLQKYNPDTNLNVLRRCMEWYADGIKRNILQRYGISTDINSFRSYDELISAMEGIMKSDDSDMSASEYNNRQKLEGQFKVLGSTSTYSVVQPLTFEAERYFGSGTEWCTVANKDYFDGYTNKGPLFILYPKDGNKEGKIQFHFETKSFADYGDHMYRQPLGCMENVIHNDEELNELSKLCANIWKDKARDFMTFEEYLSIVIQRLSDGESPDDVFDYVGSFRDGYAIIKLNNKWNWIDTECNILFPNQWFDYVGSFRDGFAQVKLNGQGYNLINQKGELINPNQWFDYVGDFREGFAKVELGRKYNLINQNWELLSPNQWFDYAGDFREGYAKVELRDKYNFINQKGDIAFPNQWFDHVGDFYEGIAQVNLNEKGCNLINQNGDILSPNQWFDYVDSFREGLASVKRWKSWNFINQKGDIISPNQWFDYVSSFSEGFAKVELKEKGCNLINQNGDILSPNQWFDYVDSFREGLATVKLNNNYYHINGEGELYDLDKNFIRNLRESVNGRRIDMIIESTLRKYLRK